MEFNAIYYIQVNVTGAVILAILYIVNFKHNKANTMENMLLKRLILANLVYGLLDVAAWISNGKEGELAVVTNYLANILFMTLPCFMSYVWVEFVHYRINSRLFRLNKLKWLFYLPLYGSAILVFTTPITNFGFTVDAQNWYHRETGAYLCPILCYAYLFYALIATIIYLKKETNEIRKEENAPLCFFILPVAIASIFQILYFGTSTSQTGFTLSILMVFLDSQYSKISIDELTGLNNRHELKSYLNSIYSHEKKDSIFLCMIDLDFFKSINDNYGHLEGDEALKNAAAVLKKVCSMHSQRFFLARYGGDEFIIAGVNTSESEIILVQEEIQRVVAETNERMNKEYKLHISSGYTYGKMCDYETVSELIAKADKAMYLVKQKRKTKMLSK